MVSMPSLLIVREKQHDSILKLKRLNYYVNNKIIKLKLVFYYFCRT